MISLSLYPINYLKFFLPKWTLLDIIIISISTLYMSIGYLEFWFLRFSIWISQNVKMSLFVLYTIHNKKKEIFTNIFSDIVMVFSVLFQFLFIFCWHICFLFFFYFVFLFFQKISVSAFVPILAAFFLICIILFSFCFTNFLHILSFCLCCLFFIESVFIRLNSY